MADDNKPAPSMELEISVDGGSRTSADFSNPDKPNVLLDGDDGVTLEFGPDGTVTNRTVDPDAEVDAPAGQGGEGDKPAEGETTEATALPELPEYNGADEGVYKSYEDAAFTFDAEGKGTLNMDALSAMWDANNGALPDGMYAFLTDATGISKEAIKEIEAGRVALREKAETELHQPFGGKAGYDAAFEWATTGNGYTAEQKARFNAAIESGDAATIKEAHELLQTRHSAATGKTAPGAERRRASPRRQASGEAQPQAQGPKPYADNKEYLADAKAKGFNNKDVRQRLEASSFWKS